MLIKLAYPLPRKSPDHALAHLEALRGLSCCYKLEVFGGRRFRRHQLANAYIRSCVSRGSIAHIHPAALQGAWSRSHAVGSVAALLVL